MMNILFLITFFIIDSIACEIHLPEYLVVIDPSAKISGATAQSGCSDKDLQKIDETLIGVEGTVSNFQLQELLKQKYVSAVVRPSLIKIQSINSLVREQLSLPSGTKLDGISLDSKDSFLALSQNTKIQVECNNCSFGSSEQIKFFLQEPSGQLKGFTSVASFRRFTKAYRLTSFHPAFAPIDVSSLKEEFVEVVPYTDLFEDLGTLKFFRTNKPIRPGELLRTADLKAENLVRAGTRTEVIIENEMLKLKTMGLSRSNGSWGQFVEVFHTERNKKYLGKVIDINKVLVEL